MSSKINNYLLRRYHNHNDLLRIDLTFTIHHRYPLTILDDIIYQNIYI